MRRSNGPPFLRDRITGEGAAGRPLTKKAAMAAFAKSWW
jgi:hypothetical protein